MCSFAAGNGGGAHGDLPAEQRISFRMGLNAADIIEENHDVYGDGVNIAARLQAYAPSGGVVVSSAVAEQIGNDLDVNVIDLGDLRLRNISRPVRVYALHPPMEPSKLVGEAPGASEPRPSLRFCRFG